MKRLNTLTIYGLIFSILVLSTSCSRNKIVNTTQDEHQFTLYQDTLPVSIAISRDTNANIKKGCMQAVQTFNAQFDQPIFQATNIVTKQNKVLIAMDASKNSNRNANTKFVFLDNGEIVSAKIQFQTANHKFSLKPENDNEFDAESVCLHELGHSVGLKHSKNVDSIMFSGIRPLQLRRSLSNDDIESLLKLYPQLRSLASNK